MLIPIPAPTTREEKINAWLAISDVVARCSETGAELKISRAQWTLIYQCDGHYTIRHWSRRAIDLDEAIKRAQKSLDKAIAAQQTHARPLDVA